MWACHNDREEDLRVSPRERANCITALSGGQDDALTSFGLLRRIARIAHLFDVGKGRLQVSAPWPAREVVEMRGLEPLTPSLQRRCSPS